MLGIEGANSGNIDISKTANSVDSVDRTTYTFTSQSFGAAHGKRYMLAFVCGTHTSSRTVSSVTIGGISATVQGSQVEGGSGGTTCMSGLYLAAVPTGTSGTVEVTWSSGVSRCGIIIYRLVGINPTAYDTGSDITVSADAVSDTMNVTAGGVIIGGVVHRGTVTARTTSWTNVTEDVDETVEGDTTQSSGNVKSGGAQSGLAITATASGALDSAALVLVSYQEE